MAQIREKIMAQIPVDMRDPETYAIIGAAMEVHREMGCGFLEVPYRHALRREFLNSSIAFRCEVEIPIYYKNDLLECYYRADFVCCESIIVEVKAVKRLTEIDRAQTINYLKATRFHRAILLNFGAGSLQYERLVNRFLS